MLSAILFLLACVVYVENCHNLKHFVALKADNIRSVLAYCESVVKVKFMLHHFITAVVLRLWFTACSDVSVS